MHRSLAFLFLALSMSACASTNAEPASSAPTEFVGAGAPECPPSDPGADQPCSKDKLACEFGGDFNPACNILRNCSRGAWSTTTLNGVENPTCPTPTAPTTPPNPAECPASAPRTSDACTVALACNYGDTTCTCSKQFWNCSKGRQFCKTPRPRVGTPCSASDQCTIQLLGECDRIVLTCSRDGTWVGSKLTCL
jgi:hypothetical protein